MRSPETSTHGRRESRRLFFGSLRRGSGSQDVAFVQVQLVIRHGQGPHVPEDPENEAEEDEQRSRQHEKVPETQRSEDPNEEQQQSHHVQDDGDGQEEAGAAVLLHGGGAQLG